MNAHDDTNGAELVPDDLPDGIAAARGFAVALCLGGCFWIVAGAAVWVLWR